MRVNESEVKALIDTTLTNEQVTPFLRAANVMVTEVLSAEGYSTDLMEQIEAFLAAHFIAIRDPRVKSETHGDASQTFHGEAGTGLNHTPYGQQVLILDINRKFAQLQEGKVGAEVRTLA